MGDANERPTTSKVHAFFQQHKRKHANDFKGTGVAPINNITSADVATNNNNTVPQPTASTMEGLPNDNRTTRPEDELADELARPEKRLNVTNELVPPEVLLNDISDEELEYHLSNLGSASVETVIHSGINGRSPAGNPNQRQERWDGRERERLVYRLDNLNDKKCRYLSHEAFLKKCLDHNLVPNGLRVYVEPSIGNRNDQFLNKWHSRLDEFA